MSVRPKHLEGDKILWRGVICEIFAIRIHDRETPEEHVEYDAETLDGETVRVREDEIVPLQQSLF